MYIRNVIGRSGTPLVPPSIAGHWCHDLFTTVHLGTAVLTLPATVCSKAQPLLVTADPRLISVDIESHFGVHGQKLCRAPAVVHFVTYLESLPTYRSQPWTSRSYSPDAPWMEWMGCLRHCKTRHATSMALQRTGLTSHDLTKILQCACA
jgi:hypothetical protein